ncbi:MAG: DUF4340 domain-containing protein [Deltaproteobacteria bacterium]|nr:DUF4340 domain-containing protein [Deltaproteobacteria bacterium]
MNPRVTGILLLCAAALGAFVWFYEIEGEADRRAAEDAGKRLFAELEADAIEWVELDVSDGMRVRAERSAGRWAIVGPLLFPGDTSAWDAIAATLASATSETLFEDPQPPAVYGLADGADEIRFAAGGEERALRLGGTAPIGSNVYAAVVGTQPVHTIASWRASSLRKEFTELRDKRVLDFDAGSVAAIEAEWPGARVALERDGDSWRMTAPVEGPADADRVTDLLSELAFLRADGFDDAPPSDADAGLAPPAYRVRLTLADAAAGDAAEAPRVLELALGSEVSDDSRYARGAQVSLYRIAAARLDDLPREVSAYRYKRLADFDSKDAQRVELVFRGPDGEPVEIVATHSDGVWSSEPEALDPAKLGTLVRELAGLTAESILAERVGPDELAGLELSPPAAAFTVRSAEGEEPLAQVRLGALQGSDGIVAQTGENPQVFRLALDLSEQLPLNLEALRNHFLQREEPAPPAVDASEGDSGFEFDLDALEGLSLGEDEAP